MFFLPLEEGGSARRRERRFQRAPVVRSSSGDAKRRDADSNGSDGARRGGDALGAGREGKGRRRIVDVVKLQLSYTPASPCLALSLALLACVSPSFATWAYELQTDGLWKLFPLNDL